MKYQFIELANPKLDRTWKAYLEYLLEYRPEQTWALFQSKKLEKLLDDKATQIASLELSLQQQGKTSLEAREIAYQEFMPADVDPPIQEQLPGVWEEQERKIWAWYDEMTSRQPIETTS